MSKVTQVSSIWSPSPFEGGSLHEDISPHLENSITTIKNVSQLIKDVLDLIAPFFPEDGTDVATSAIKAILDPIFTYVKGALTSSASGILIHPGNKSKKYELPLFPWGSDIPPIPLLTPRGAFNELFSSFKNSNDPFRPMWPSDGDVAGGFGILISVSYIEELLSFLPLLKMIGESFNFKEIEDLFTNYCDKMEEYIAQEISFSDQKINFGEDSSLKKIGESTSNIIPNPTNNPYWKEIEKFTTIWKGDNTWDNIVATALLGFDLTPPQKDDLPNPHWVSVSAPLLFPGINSIIKELEVLGEKLAFITQETVSTVSKIIKSIKKKVDVLETLIINVINLLDKLLSLTSISAAAIHTILIPPTTETSPIKGVDYLISEIKNEVFPNDNIKTILDTHSLSILLFFTAGSGNIVFNNLMNTLDTNLKELGTLLSNQGNETPFRFIDFEVRPRGRDIDFKDPPSSTGFESKTGTIINTSENDPKSITFDVLCASDTDDDPVYYTWKVEKADGSPLDKESKGRNSFIGRIISAGWDKGKPSDENKLLRTNKDSFTISVENSNTLTVTVFRRLEGVFLPP